MTIDIVDFPMENGGSFHSYVNVYQAGYILTIIPVQVVLIEESPALPGLHSHKSAEASDPWRRVYAVRSST